MTTSQRNDFPVHEQNSPGLKATNTHTQTHTGLSQVLARTDQIMLFFSFLTVLSCSIKKKKKKTGAGGAERIASSVKANHKSMQTGV